MDAIPQASPTFATELTQLLARHFGEASDGQSTAMLQSLGIAVGAPTMPLSEFFNDKYLLEHELAKATVYFYRMKIKTFSEFLGKPATLADLNDDTVNRFIMHRSTIRRPDTVRGERSSLVSLWKWAVQHRLVPMPPSRLRKLKRSTIIPKGFNPDELQRLLRTALKRRGCFRGKGIKRSSYWYALFLTAYYTGLRLGDLENLDSAEIRGPGTYTIVQLKTKKPLDITISEQVWQAIEATNPRSRKKIFGIMSRASFYDDLSNICEDSDVDGAMKFFRRTSGSMVESVAPGQGYKHLGHSDRGETFDRHYNVREFTRRPPVLPPAIQASEILSASTDERLPLAEVIV